MLARWSPQSAKGVNVPARDHQRVEPRGLSRTEAAEYVGVGASLFDEMVSDGRMPPAKCINRRRVWDRRELDDAFAQLPVDGAAVADDWVPAL